MTQNQQDQLASVSDSKVLSNINKPSGIEKIVRAVSHIRDNFRQTHMPEASNAQATQDVPVGHNNASIEAEIDWALRSMHDQAFELLEANKHVLDRGYFAVHRMVARLLPKQFSWTCDGIDIVNQLLAKSPVTKEIFLTWSLEIENHLKEMREHEAEHARRVARYQLETAEQKQILEDEVVNMLRNKDERVRNYGKLFNYLHKGLGRGFRGSRGVGIIHSVMTEKLKWSTYWEKWMRADMQHAKQHDEEMRAVRQQRRQQRAHSSREVEQE